MQVRPSDSTLTRSIVVFSAFCHSLTFHVSFSVVTGATDGIGKAYAMEVSGINPIPVPLPYYCAAGVSHFSLRNSSLLVNYP